jgi:DNA-binding CsgD family transcriptional regulator
VSDTIGPTAARSDTDDEAGASETVDGTPAATALVAAVAAYAAGDVSAAVAGCVAVAELTDEPEVLARAALVVHGVSGQFNGALVGLCDRALAALPAGATALRARVTAQRVLAIGEVLGGSEVALTSAAALAAAEASGDAAATMRALQARHAALAAPELAPERVVLAEKMIALATGHDDSPAELWGRLWRVDAAFELGEPTVLRQEVARLGLLAERRGWSLGQWHAHRLRAAAALLGGDFAVVEAELALARDAATRTGEPVHLLLLDLVDFERRNLTGALEGVVGRVQAFASGFGQLPIAWSNGGAVLLAAGDRDSAQTCYERLAPVLRELPRDGRWLYTVVGAAELAIAFEDEEGIDWCRRVLLPLAGRCQASAGGTIVCRASVDRLLGQLAAAMGEFDAAVGSLVAAIDVETRIGAVPYRTLSQLLLADVLARRAGAGNLERAHDLVRAAAGAARRLGMAPALARADELTRTLHRTDTEAVRLTARERDVVALLASGGSNRTIAASLVLSERTVEYHVANVLAKIGAANRTEAAMWAVRHGLGDTGAGSR